MNSINSLTPAVSIITGDFNGKCSKWYSFDISDNIGKEFDTITSTAGYSQIIDEPTHFTSNSSSCIDLIFTSNPSILVDSGIEKSVSSSCHHDIIYGKINFRIPLPPPHCRTVWDHKNADAISVQRVRENFNWQYAFERKPINEKIQVFSENLMNILSKYVPHKLLKFNYKQLPSMNLKMFSSLRKRAKLSKLFYKNTSNSLKELLMSKSTECSNLILTAKENYQKKMAEKLDNPFTAPKAYWSILNNFLGKRKTPNIPPLIVNDFAVSDFTTKANLFNNFFASQCSPVVNSSPLPNFCYKTQKRISNIEIKEDDILLIIKNLNPNKALGWDNVSISIIQLCVKSIVKLLKYLFVSSLTAGIFPEGCKKANIIPVHKKESKNCLKNYRPISLLPIFSKIFEKLIFNALFHFFV